MTELGLFINCFFDKSREETCHITSNAGYVGIEPGAGGFPSTSHCIPEKLLKDRDLLDNFIKTLERQVST